MGRDVRVGSLFARTVASTRVAVSMTRAVDIMLSRLTV